ncbi:MAG TPA: hypothetical protein VKC65_05570 [Gaiellaceae bacterium]|nr:hypothetical protein [Gaiellaceae bacterium]
MRAIAYSVAAGLVLVGLYLALGGASYAPAKVADPCVQRSWRGPKGFEAVAEQIVLSALDGAACQLHVSREDMVLALASQDRRDEFIRDHHITNAELESLVRNGLKRSIDDAQNAGALNPTLAGILRGVVGNLPIDELLDLLQRLRGL